MRAGSIRRTSSARTSPASGISDSRATEVPVSDESTAWSWPRIQPSVSRSCGIGGA